MRVRIEAWRARVIVKEKVTMSEQLPDRGKEEKTLARQTALHQKEKDL